MGRSMKVTTKTITNWEYFENSNGILEHKYLNTKMIEKCKYDSNGILLYKQKRKNFWKYEYDSNGRLLYIEMGKYKDNELNISYLNYGYDSNGKLFSIIDSMEKITKFEYNSNGELLQIQYASGICTRFKFEHHENLKNFTIFLSEYGSGDGFLTYTEYKYDSNGRLILERLYEHERSSQLRGRHKEIYGEKVHTYKNDNYKKYEYDSNGRLVFDCYDRISLSYNKSYYEYHYKENNYSYDSNGRLIRKNNKNYEYDSNGRLIKEFFDDQYDEDGRLIWMEPCKYEYDTNGRLIKESFNKTIVFYEYDSNGRLIKEEVRFTDYKSYYNDYSKCSSDSSSSYSSQDYFWDVLEGDNSNGWNID